jgi:hypothetical protein
MEFKKPIIVNSFDDIDIYKLDLFINKVGNAAMNEEKKRFKEMKVPAAFMHNGKILYELPDGTITPESPWGSGKEEIPLDSLKMALSEEPLKRVWDNEDDDVYN